MLTAIAIGYRYGTRSPLWAAARCSARTAMLACVGARLARGCFTRVTGNGGGGTVGRHIDTASLYDNEEEVGRALRDSGIPREELFVTTKLWNDDHGFNNAVDACERSLERLGLGECSTAAWAG